MKSFIFILTLSQLLYANFLDDNLRKQEWNNIEIIWLEDNNFPNYNVSIVFEDGAYNDPKGKEGITSLALNLMTMGTSRYDQNKILETIEFYGASQGASVTHEYSTFNVSGLVKDIVPTMKMVCHLFNEATFPKRELAVSLKRLITSQRNMINDHGSLASHIARIVSLRKTGYERPTGGTIKSLSGISQRDLRNRLNDLNKNAKKRIYIKGPSEVMALKKIIKNDCAWSNKDTTSIESPKVTQGVNPNSGGMFFVPVKDANQAQIRIVNYMTYQEAHKDYVLNKFTSKFIGGGFTSRLMQVLRVQRGLTYSVGAFAAGQMNYGRKGISTFTKNETLIPMLKSIEEVINKNSKNMDQEKFAKAKKYVKGNYLYELESTTSFLGTLQYYDTVGRPYEDIYKFSQEIDNLKLSEAQSKVKSLFADPQNITIIVGNKTLLKKLRKEGYKVMEIKANRYL